MWIYAIAMTIVIVCHLVRIWIDRDMRWFTILTSFGLGFCWAKFLIQAVTGKI